MESASGEHFGSFDPATGEKLSDVQCALTEEIDRAVEAAREDYAVWSRTTGTERGRVLKRAAEILRAQRASRRDRDA